jgi:glycosyltransferase involved in cell wall biosynthesis
MIISIVTPTLNASRYLGQCIDSVKADSCPGVEAEHIIVDGGSTDGTIEIAHAKGVRVLAGKDSGIFDAINKGSFASSGVLLGFLGADDMLVKGALQAIAKEYGQGQPRWISGGVRWIDGSGNFLGSRSAPPQWMGLRSYASLGWSCFAHMSTYLTREFFDELGGFDRNFTVTADYDLFARALSRCRCRRIGRNLAVSRLTGMNFSTVQKVRSSRECAVVMDAFGPKPLVQRRLYGTLLRVWVNASNPLWSFRKRRGRSVT